MKSKGNFESILVSLGFSLFFLVVGVKMIVEDKVAFGYNRALQPSGYGGHLLIIAGIIFLVVTYFSLSPFSKFRQFFEGKPEVKKKNKAKEKRSDSKD
ncbi:MAG: hypothetical protein AAF944_17250 [Bacteroidota bacterium]